MTLNLGCCSSSSYLSRFSHSPTLLSKLSPKPNYTTTATLLSLLFSFHKTAPFFSTSRTPSLKPLASSLSQSADDDYNNSFLSLNEDSLSRVSAAKDANEALQIIAVITNKSNGLVSVTDCCGIISAAIDRGNSDLALSVFYAMRSSFDQGVTEIERWKWSRPDVSVYTSLVQGLAAALKVSDALKMIDYICRVGVSPSEEEVPFGKVVRCPTCMIAVAVAQPQHGIQIASCAKCRYQYELVSGDITSIDSEAIRKYSCRTQHGSSCLGKGAKIVATNEAKYSCSCSLHCGMFFLNLNVNWFLYFIQVQTPSGMARTQRFATETVDLPAQKGERVTIASAVPSNVYRNAGPFKFSPKAPNVYPGEPMCLTNHENGRESLLLRAPVKDGKLSLLNPSVLVPLLAVLVAGDAASGIIDPSLPQFLVVAAISSFGAGATLNTLVFPRLNQLPQKSVDATAIKQKLLSQYDLLQSRIKELKEAAEKEVWMLARMCQLENKIFAVGEPSYRARRTRVKRVREGLENSLEGRIELIDSYARVCF
ncbi:hypothetical protein NC653_001044 [Populus alba x Populus x berolinensis]|uniref:Pentatricopeptide repeat-containing protein n=1 Tax=Populus alba x Populus x berolinensis TaxID=444605 RepID=A0AAD6WF21_9ROSI|nr:hypothetical protein NC653_001044 [Populus alba x Populus x berolinensis]